MLKIFGYAGTGLGSAVLAKKVLESITPKLIPYNFEVFTLDTQGNIINPETREAKYFPEKLSKNVNLNMVKIPGGSYLMGTKQEEVEKLLNEYPGWTYIENEIPQHRVKIKPFFLGMYQVTQAQWQAVMGGNPALFKDNLSNPVEQISWEEAEKFCQILSDQTKRKYRLPSEAEWEYACRAGTTTPFHFGEKISTKYVNYKGTYNPFKLGVEEGAEYRKQTTKVGIFPPNAFGLYDMHGNVWEWCKDSWHNYYTNAPDDGSAWELGGSTAKVMRGGTWDVNPGGCRSAYRGSQKPNVRSNTIGFRVVCVI